MTFHPQPGGEDIKVEVTVPNVGSIAEARSEAAKRTKIVGEHLVKQNKKHAISLRDVEPKPSHAEWIRYGLLAVKGKK